MCGRTATVFDRTGLQTIGWRVIAAVTRLARHMGIRHQLPVYSPVTAKASLLAVAQALHLGGDPRPELRALLAREYDAKSVLLCGSGTQALTIAIREARRWEQTCVSASTTWTQTLSVPISRHSSECFGPAQR
jgi:acetylornithine/succinyldiaminopimelate/putrescine aminotransferase